MATIMFNLKDRVVEKQYQFITSTFNSCLYFPGFNSVNTITSKIDEFCNNEYFQKLKKILINEKDSIIILGGRFPLYLSNYKFDNKEGGIEGGKRGSQFISLGKYDSLKSSFNSEVLELSNSNKIILIYPIPEVGLDPNKKFFTQWTKKRFAKNFDFKSITTSYKVYKDRTKTSFELLNSIQGDNIYRVFPHKLFCNISIKDRCVTNDDKNIFYGDDNHPSLEGVKIINDLVIDEIKKIELKLPN